MNKKDIRELKSRFTKNGCTFTKISGCYVNAHKEILVNFNQTFLNLEDVEFYKYLEIAKKALSGTIGNNLLQLPFLQEEEGADGKQRLLMGIKESKLKDMGLLGAFYQRIIENYDYAGNYLILAFHDAYDVISKTSDNLKLDESEEVYEYVIFAICPVELTKPGLGNTDSQYNLKEINIHDSHIELDFDHTENAMLAGGTFAPSININPLGNNTLVIDMKSTDLDLDQDVVTGLKEFDFIQNAFVEEYIDTFKIHHLKLTFEFDDKIKNFSCTYNLYDDGFAQPVIYVY